MLVGQHSGRHEDRHLLGVAGGLEGGTDGYFCFPESYVSAYQTVHRTRAFHVCLHLIGGFQLIGSIFIEETGFQFVLHERVCTEGISFLMAPGSIQFNKVARDVFNPFLGPLLHSFPCTGADCRQSWRGLAVFALVFAYFIERMYAYVHFVIVGIDDANHFLISILRWMWVMGRGRNGYAYQSGKTPDAQVDMYNVVSWLHFLQFFQRQSHFSSACGIAFQVVFMEPVENLMVGEDT